MNRYLIVSGIVVLLICVGLSGCEELEELDKPDYILVRVYCKVEAVIHDDSGASLPAEGVYVEIEAIKAGGERVSQRGLTPTGMTAIFKLYREQPITCIANVVLISGVDEEYPKYTFHGASHTISWNEIYPQHDFGDQAYKDVTLVIHGYKKEN